MSFRTSLIFCFLLFIQKIGVASDDKVLLPLQLEKTDTIYIALSQQPAGIQERPSPILHLFRNKQKKNKKAVAALLAFPFPFGIVGLHRIYMGCAPYVPVAYIGSLGGVFGILPFIDFCVLLLDKDIDRYINNKKIFMWIH